MPLGLTVVHAEELVQTRIVDEVVVTGTRSGQSVMELAGNTAQITDEEMQLIGATHINEAVWRIPGAWVSRGNGQEHLTAIRSPVFTGAGACGAFLMAEDGISLRAAGFCNVNQLFEANSEQAGAVEVVRGPGSALYGSNALHGVVNVLTPAPVEHDYRASVEAGPHEYARVMATASRKDSEQGYRFSVNLTEDGGWRDDSGVAQQKLNYRHEFYGDDTDVAVRLAATNLRQDTAGFIEGEEAYKDEDLIDQNFDPEAYRNASAFRLSTRIEHRFSDTESLVVTPYVRKVDMEFLQHFLPQDPLEENGHTSFGTQVQWHRMLDAGHRVVAGVDLELTQGFLKETQEKPTGGFGGAFPTGKHYDFEVDATVVAPFIHGEWAVDEKTRITTGLRAEYTGYEYDNKMIDGNTAADGTPCGTNGCRFSRPADRDDDFTDISPKLGVVYRVKPDHALYGNLSRGFRAPQANELYRLQAGQSVADLESVEMDSVEIGARGSQGAFSYDVAVFAMNKSNVIFQDDNRANISGGETEHRGIEASVLARMSDAFDAQLSLTLAKHTYASDEVIQGGTIESGDEIDTAPSTMGALIVGWNFMPGSRAELELVHMGEYFTDVGNEHTYPGHELINLRVSSAVTEMVRVFGRVLNVADERYAERADFAFGDDRFFPGEPRSVYAGVEMSF